MTGATSKRSKLETQLRNAEAQLAHKRDVMSRHAPGTAHHTRARKEADSIASRIERIRTQLRQCAP